MSSIGSSAVSCVADPASRVLRTRGACWTRQAVTLNLSGHGHAAADLVALAFYKGVFVAGISAGGFSGTTELASGVLDTNMEEFEALLVGLRRGDVLPLEIHIWDSNPASLELVCTGVVEIMVSGPGYTAETGAEPVTPVIGSSGTLGTFGWKDGKTYFRNDDIEGPFNWFPVELRGSAGSMYIDYSAPGVSFS